MSSVQHLKRLLGERVDADAAAHRDTVGTSVLANARIIAVDRIVADPAQPRREFDAEELNNLTESLKSHGQTDPVKVRWDASQDRYVIRDGERRWRAAKVSGMTTLTAIIDNRDMTADRVLEMQVIENALRSDLTPLEAAEAYRTLMETWGCSQQALAARLHISQSRVSRAMAALTLPAEVKRDVDAGKVGAIAAVKKAARQSGRRKPAKPKAARIATAAGTVIVTPKAGQSVVDVLVAALDAERKRSAA